MSQQNAPAAAGETALRRRKAQHPSGERILSVQEMADRIGVNKATLWRWAALGKFAIYKYGPGNKRGQREGEFNTWLASREKV